MCLACETGEDNIPEIFHKSFCIIRPLKQKDGADKTAYMHWAHLVSLQDKLTVLWTCANPPNYVCDENPRKRISMPFRLESLCKQDVRISTAKPNSTFHKYKKAQ